MDGIRLYLPEGCKMVAESGREYTLIRSLELGDVPNVEDFKEPGVKFEKIGYFTYKGVKIYDSDFLVSAAQLNALVHGTSFRELTKWEVIGLKILLVIGFIAACAIVYFTNK